MYIIYTYIHISVPYINSGTDRSCRPGWTCFINLDYETWFHVVTCQRFWQIDGLWWIGGENILDLRLVISPSFLKLLLALNGGALRW